MRPHGYGYVYGYFVLVFPLDVLRRATQGGFGFEQRYANELWSWGYAGENRFGQEGCPLTIFLVDYEKKTAEVQHRNFITRKQAGNGLSFFRKLAFFCEIPISPNISLFLKCSIPISWHLINNPTSFHYSWSHEKSFPEHSAFLNAPNYLRLFPE